MLTWYRKLFRLPLPTWLPVVDDFPVTRHLPQSPWQSLTEPPTFKREDSIK